MANENQNQNQGEGEGKADPKKASPTPNQSKPPQQQSAAQQSEQGQAPEAQSAGEPKQSPAPGNARTSGNSRDLVRDDSVIGPVSPTRAKAIQLGREAAAKSGAPKLPTAQELDRIRDEYFGGNAGTVRVDAPPAGSGPDAPPTKLIFFDADGRKAGERDYTGPDSQE